MCLPRIKTNGLSILMLSLDFDFTNSGRGTNTFGVFLAKSKEKPFS